MTELANEDYRRLLDALPCYATLLDRQLRIVWCNTLCVRDFGPPTGKTCYQHLGIDKSRCSECPVKKTFSQGGTHSSEMTLTTMDGARVNVIVYSAPITNLAEEIDFVIRIAVDITPVKEIQSQLILLGQTVAGMAHSIKNIMMGLEGGIYVVNKGIEAKNQDEVKDGWDMVLFNFDKISHIVRDILYCSKDREPNLEKINPNDVVREVDELFKDAAARYSIEIKLQLDENVTEAVMDPSGLHTVLANLVGNAMDACKIDLWKDEHLVEIRTKRGRDGSTIFEVADNGIGIDKKIKGHVFEDFFSSKGDQGTGLGLMVTQKILREHGGSITFRSRPGQGTTFIATFPARDLPAD